MLVSVAGPLARLAGLHKELAVSIAHLHISITHFPDQG